MRTERFDIIIIGSGAGGGTVRARACWFVCPHPRPRTWRLRPAGGRELGSGGGVEAPAVPCDRAAGSIGRGREFQPYTHYCVGGNTKFWGSVLYRLRREDFQAVEHADGTSPAWPIDYETLESYYERAERLYHVRGQQGVDPTEPPRGPYPYEPVPHAPAIAAIVERLRGLGLHPSPLPLGVLRPGEPGGCILCNTCNSFSVQGSREERRRGLLHSRDAAAVDCESLDQRLRATLADRPFGQKGRSGRSRAERRHVPGRGASRHRVVRRGEFSGVAAAVGQRAASRWPRQLVGPRRSALHGAPGDDDARLPSVPPGTRRCFRRRSA